MYAASATCWLALLLAIATAVLFWPATRNGFVNLDDPDYFTANPVVQKGLTVEGVKWAFQAGYAGNWHPVTWVSHLIDAELFGNKPAGPHAVNVAWHGLNAALVFLLLTQLTGSRWRSLLAAAFFAFHPTHVESVAWVSERKDVLSACFGLLALIAYAAYVRSKAEGRKSKAYYGLALACLALGLMSKPMLVTWPLVMLLLDWWPLRRLSRVEGRESKAGVGEPSTLDLRPSTFRPLLLEKLPFVALVVVSCVVTIIAQERGGAMHTIADTSLAARIGNAVVAYGRYLGKTFWPTDLAVPYPHPGQWPIVTVLACAAGLMSVTLGTFLARRRWPAGWMGWSWFFGTMVPVIGLVQVGSQSMADRYTYLPSIGLFIALVWGSWSVVEGRKSKVERRWRTTAGIAGTVVILAALSWLTRGQISVWRDTETLFQHAVQVTKGNYIAHYNLGHYYQEQGRRTEAFAQYLRTTELKPQYPNAWNNLGVLLTEDRKFAEAVPYFQAALKHKPGDGEFRTNVVRCLALAGKERAKAGRWAEALPLLREAVALGPESFEAQNALGSTLAMSGQVAEAVTHFRAAVTANPNRAVAHLNLGRALAALGQTEESETELRRAQMLMKLQGE